MGGEGQEEIPQVPAGNGREAQQQPEAAIGRNAADRERETRNPTNEGPVDGKNQLSEEQGDSWPEDDPGFDPRANRCVYCPFGQKLSMGNGEFPYNPGDWGLPPGHNGVDGITLN